MSPEKNHQGKKQDAKKGDIYSLGVIIYFSLFGTYPTLKYDKKKSKPKSGFY
jgi:serine/threonine protein kinase